ncbi:MAG TPA: tetratricopeptide repeat protein [Candidatus Melainabacteria bacterium]|nr:tetratricopeptide repeat protein [Candidatus Melainabacteria bacterium]
MNKLLLSSMVAILSGLLTLTAPPAEAAEVFSEAVSLYKQGEHKKAAGYFEHIIKHKPEHWQSHYYLANIHLKNNNLTEARKYYNSCVLNYPDIPTCQNIVKALAHIDKLEAAGRSTASANTTGNTALTASDESDPEEKKRLALAQKLEAEEAERIDERTKALKEKKRKILEDGEREANAVIANAQAKLARMHNESNWYVKNTRTGEVSVGLPSFVADQVMAEAYESAKQIKKTAGLRARGIHIPKTSNDSLSLRHQLTAKPGPSGTTMDTVGTNTYVRNYTHTKKQIAGRESNRL